MLKEFYTKNKQHIIIIALFMAVSLAYCYPVLSGKKLNQNDDLSAKALNVEAEKYHKKTGEFVGWTNSMFSGMPTSVGYSGVSNYSTNLIYFFANTFKGFSFDVIFWSLVGMYLLFCILGINPWLGALGSFIFAFSSFNILSLEAGHVQKMFNISFIPLLLGGIYLIFQKRYVWGFIAVAFGVNYQIGLAHYQVTYYAAIAGIIICIYYGVKWVIKQEFKPLGIAISLLLLGSVMGSLPNLTVLNTYYASHETTRGGASELSTPSNEQTQDTTKNKDGLGFGYATAWSYGINETFTLLVPNALGGEGNNLAYDFDKRGNPKPKEDSETYQALQQNVTDNNQYSQLAGSARAYWGDQPFVGGPIYFGAIVCFLAVFGLIASKRDEKWWILAITLVFLLLAWGRHSFLYSIFFDYLPFFNKFRTPSMALGVVQICFSLLAILGIAEIFKVKEENKLKLSKILLYTGAGFGALLLILAAAPSILFDFTSVEEYKLMNDSRMPDWLISAMGEDRASLMKADALRSLAFIGLAILVLWLYLKGSIEKVGFALTLVATLVVVDLWNFNLRYLNKDKFVTPRQIKSATAPLQADLQISQDTDPHFRVLNLSSRNPFSDYITSYHHHSIGGYHGAKLRKYQELIENQINTMNPSVLAMLNTKYLIVDGGKQGPVVQRPLKNPMGNAWFVKNLKIVKNGDEEMAALSVDSVNVFEPAQDLIVQEKNLPNDLKGFTPKTDPIASIILTEYAPHRLKYQSKTNTEQIAAFSEVFYQLEDGDGWKAYIDNELVDHFRANYILRALKIPVGEHTIEFKYDASQSINRVRLSFVFLLLLILVSAGAVYLKRKGKIKVG